MRHSSSLILLLMIVAAASAAWAQGSDVATQSLTLEVKPLTKIAVSGNPNALVITDALAGSDLTAVQDQNTTYSITTNLSSMKIIASISNGMPAGTKLMIRLASNSGLSRGTVDISDATSPVDVVTGIAQGNDANQSITYQFSANADVPSFSNDSRVITLTLTN